MPYLRRAAAPFLLFLTVGLASCGGATTSGGDDPASAVPRDAPLYFEATVRPEGSLRDDALAAAGKVLQTDDPEAKIEELVAKAFADSDDPKLDYARDIEPWLGEKVAAWFSAPSGNSSAEEANGVGIISAKDEDKAREAVDRAISSSSDKFTEREFEGVSYQAGPDGAVAVTDGCGAGRDGAGAQAHDHARSTATRWPRPTATRTRSTSWRTTGWRTSSSTRRRSSTPR